MSASDAKPWYQHPMVCGIAGGLIGGGIGYGTTSDDDEETGGRFGDDDGTGGAVRGGSMITSSSGSPRGASVRNTGNGASLRSI